MSRAPHVPGDAGYLNNIPPDNSDGAKAANSTAADRERLIQVTASLATGGQGNIAPSPPAEDVDNGIKILPGGARVRVNQIKANPMVRAYGPESKHPKGTAVRRDGTPCEGDEQPYGVVGDIEVPGEGWLVSRIIPLSDLSVVSGTRQSEPDLI